MKKYIIFILWIIGVFLLQSSPLYEHIGVRGVTPDFLLIMISLAAFILGPIAGQIIGFITGFIVDIIPTVELLGLSAFAFTLIGYVIGIAGQKVYGNSVLIIITLLFVVTLVKAIVLSLFAALFLEPGYFGYFSHGKIFLEAVLNSIIAPVLLIIFTKIERKIA